MKWTCILKSMRFEFLTVFAFDQVGLRNHLVTVEQYE